MIEFFQNLINSGFFTLERILLICAAVVILILIIVIAVVASKRNKNKKVSKADNVKQIDGVRYTTDNFEFTENNDVKITHRVGDVVLSRGQTYRVAIDGQIIPGKYTVLSVSESEPKFNLRIGGLVREYSHAADIVLNDGDTISAVSHNVILR